MNEKLLEALKCHAEGNCGDCPFFVQLEKDGKGKSVVEAVMNCKELLFKNILLEIHRLSTDVASKSYDIGEMLNEREYIIAERDAAVNSLKGNCLYCKKKNDSQEKRVGDFPVNLCPHMGEALLKVGKHSCEFWEWEGLKEGTP